MKQDDLYRRPLDPVADFVFDDQVVAVFPDMIQRSVPGYAHVIAMSGVLAGYYAKPQTHLYDLGASLGATCHAIRTHVKAEGCTLIGVDNAPAMVDACQKLFMNENQTVLTKFVCADIREVEITRASVVTMNFTLQFVPIEDRLVLLRKIYAGMVEGGILLISEKTLFTDVEKQARFTTLHHHFKRVNGYSDLEIAQKRAAIEHVLIPESIETHLKRLEEAGFKCCDVWFQSLNFSSFIALK